MQEGEKRETVEAETSTEEEVAFCLMMLSRNKSKRKENQNHHQQEQYYEEEEEEEAQLQSIEETDESEQFKASKTRNKYRCETCMKVFKSYQALGGHRGSHKKLKLHSPVQETELVTREVYNSAVTSHSSGVKRGHECPYCYRIFPSGQALGGHKRSHLVTTATGASARRSTTALIKIEDELNLLDLNLPAPVDDDDLNHPTQK